jgi:hypothetical protein
MIRALLLATLLLVGCTSVPSTGVPPTSVSASELDPLLYSEFGIAGQVADDVYLLPSLNWVETDFTSAWFTFASALGLWTEEENDCDDFARGAAFFAQVLNHNTPRKPHAALAFGEFWYQRDSGTAHAINFFVYRAAGKLKIGFYEPQGHIRVNLSNAEVHSCRAWKL